MGATILVADDDRAIRMVLNQALARLGHDVRMAGNAATLWGWIADGIGDHGGVIEFDSQPRRPVFRVCLPVVSQAGVAQHGSG